MLDRNRREFIMQLGGAAEPNQQPQVDLLGARQSIDMLSILAEKSKGNLTEAEDRLLQSALFEELQHRGWSGHVSFSPDSAFLACAYRDGSIRLWDPETGSRTGPPQYSRE